MDRQRLFVKITRDTLPQIKDKYRDYMTQYADYYGPLDKLHISNDNYWMWVATPMPWEMEGC
jgi:spore coat protein JB